ncbi:uncharacterized protein LOC105801050 [Gossypium raimondii]|uniref:uncharacterized protein LOC105801050 n=1 Tax=Gossypium raimondii TaxID=29730 RepID=UPI00227C59AA|nr:uncharacterized protein LOC105801050 [Gossypium raimondii]
MGYSIENCIAFKKLVEKLISMGVVKLDDSPNAKHPLPNHNEVNMMSGNMGRNVKTDVVDKENYCEFHHEIGHEIQECTEFKTLVQCMIDNKEMEFYEEVQEEGNICTSKLTVGVPKANYPMVIISRPKNSEVRTKGDFGCYGRRGSRYRLSHMLWEALLLDKPPSRTDKRRSEYSVVEQLHKQPARISALALLLSSEAHRSALMKVLNETDSTKALHITTRCKGYTLPRVFIDNGSALNVLPLSTLDRLPVDSSHMKACQNIVRAFDGTERRVMGRIEISLIIGPTTYEVDFLVMDIKPSYNCLLGRPWIHSAGAVPSLLHQKLKLLSEGRLVTISVEEDIIATGDKIPVPRISKTMKMGLQLMVGMGALLGRVLGRHLQGRVEAPVLKDKFDRFGLGYRPDMKQKKKEIEKRQERIRARLSGKEVKPSDINDISDSVMDPENPFERDKCLDGSQDFGDDIDGNLSPDLLRMVEQEEKQILPYKEVVEIVTLKEGKIVKMGTCITEETKQDLIELLQEFKDVFAWSYQDMPSLNTDIIVHRLPIKNDCKPVQQKLRRMRSDVVLKIKEEVQKQFDAGFLQVVKYSEWVANIVPVPKKDGKVRMCVDYMDLNKASPKDNFPFPHVHTLVDNTAGYSLFSFMDDFSRYNEIKMHPEDMTKTTFITLWGTFCYKVMSFRLKNVRATYQRAMVTLFHYMMHKEVEVYVDDMIAKSQTEKEHVQVLRKLFLRLRKFQLKLNPAKCTFGTRSGKLLRFVVSEKGIKINPDKVTAIQELPLPRTQKEVRGFLGRLNYIVRFISQLTEKCDLIFRLLKKHNPGVRDEECQKAFDRVKQYLSSTPVLSPPNPNKPLILYLTVFDKSMGCVLGQHDETGRKEKKVVKGSAIVDFLASRALEDYEPLDFDFPNADLMCVATAE